MKKIIIYSLAILLLTACSDNKNEAQKNEVKRFELIIEKGKNNYYLTLEGKNGDKTKQKVEFSIDYLVIDSLKLTEQKIKSICENALLYSDWNVNFKPTYKHGDDAMLYYGKEENSIKVHVKGTAENAYGVPDNISSTISFNLKGKMINDKDGLPDILTY
jgi:hypothetical protein